MSLPSDYTRCTGYLGLTTADPVCPLRETCARFLAMATDRERYGDGCIAHISVTAGLCRNDPAYSHLIPVLP